MTCLYLTRHAETVWNSEHRMQGWADSPLSPEGIEQAEALCRHLADVHLDAIYASDTGRAQRTADIARGARDMPIHARRALREMHFPRWDGLLLEEAKARYPTAFEQFWKQPVAYRPVDLEGETYADVQARALQALHAIAREHPAERVLVVSHTITIKVLLAHFTGRPLDEIWELAYLRPTSISIIEMDGDDYRVIRQGADDHLPDAPATFT